jgi:hypothetical protein
MRRASLTGGLLLCEGLDGETIFALLLKHWLIELISCLVTLATW